jgi:ornithine--oxo-acid transaminase
MKDQCEILSLNSRALYNDKLGPAEKYLSELLGFDKSFITNTGNYIY